MKVEPKAPSFAELERLATSADIRDRAFAAGVLSLCVHDAEKVATLYERIRETARSHHAGMRARIRDGTLDKQRSLPICERHHLRSAITSWKRSWTSRIRRWKTRRSRAKSSPIARVGSPDPLHVGELLPWTGNDVRRSRLGPRQGGPAGSALDRSSRVWSRESIRLSSRTPDRLPDLFDWTTLTSSKETSARFPCRWLMSTTRTFL